MHKRFFLIQDDFHASSLIINCMLLRNIKNGYIFPLSNRSAIIASMAIRTDFVASLLLSEQSMNIEELTVTLTDLLHVLHSFCGHLEGKLHFHIQSSVSLLFKQNTECNNIHVMCTSGMQNVLYFQPHSQDTKIHWK